MTVTHKALGIKVDVKYNIKKYGNMNLHISRQLFDN